VNEGDVDQATLDLINEHGGFDGDRGNDGYSSEAKAIVSLAGAVYDLNWIDSGELPVICIHSVNDPEVPYITGVNNNGTIQYGSSQIIEKALQVNVVNKLVPINGADHNAPSNCDTCFEEVLKFLYPLIK
jgi:hypothetical protein